MNYGNHDILHITLNEKLNILILQNSYLYHTMVTNIATWEWYNNQKILPPF